MSALNASIAAREGEGRQGRETGAQIMQRILAPYNARGWPRHYANYRAEDPDDEAPEDEGRQLPVPWVVGPNAHHNDWGTFYGDRVDEALDQRLCGICAEPLGDTILLGIGIGEAAREDRCTSGPGNCPRCMVVSLSHCPHLAGIPAGDCVGWVYLGAGNGTQPPQSNLGRYSPRVDESASEITAEQAREILRNHGRTPGVR